MWSLVLHCLPIENEYVWVWNSDDRVDTTVSFIHKYANHLSHLFPIMIRAKIAGNTYLYNSKNNNYNSYYYSFYYYNEPIITTKTKTTILL